MRTTAPILLLSALILLSGAPIARAEHDCQDHKPQGLAQKQPPTPAPAETSTTTQQLEKAPPPSSTDESPTSMVEDPAGGLDDLGDVGGDFEE